MIRKRRWETKTGEPRSAWVVDYYAFDAKAGKLKRNHKTFKTKREAKAWWDGRVAQEVQRGTHTPESRSITLAEAGERWLERAEAEGLEYGTRYHYAKLLEHLVPRLGDVKLAKLTTPGLERIRDELLLDLPRPLAKKVLMALKAILGEAHRRGEIGHNPAGPVAIKDRKRDRRKIEVGVDVPSREEIGALLAAAEGRGRPLLMVAAFCGLRSSELRGLTWSSVDFEAKVIRVRQRADYWNDLGRPKSHAGDRDVPMPDLVANTLREWRLACPKGELDLVFPTGRGNVENAANLHKREVGATCERAGLVRDDGRPKYSLHPLRHFYASWLIAQGVKPKTIQTYLGHASITMTFDTYGHWLPSDDDEQALLSAGALQVIGGAA